MFTCIVAIISWSAPDLFVAGWFHQRLSPAFADVLLAMSQPGSAVCVTTLFLSLMLLLFWKRSWRTMLTLVSVVPVGALLAELLKLIIRRDRPYFIGPFGEWGGYSFPSGHTTAATLIYGFMLLSLLPWLPRRRWRLLAVILATCLITCVGFSRIALGAHYLTDVLGAMTLSIIWLTLCSVFAKRRPAIIPVPSSDSVER